MLHFLIEQMYLMSLWITWSRIRIRIQDSGGSREAPGVRPCAMCWTSCCCAASWESWKWLPCCLASHRETCREFCAFDIWTSGKKWKNTSLGLHTNFPVKMAVNDDITIFRQAHVVYLFDWQSFGCFSWWSVWIFRVFMCFLFLVLDLWDELMGKSRYRPHAGDKWVYSDTSNQSGAVTCAILVL